MEPLVATVEEVLARIAGTSHGVVTRQELLRAGITREQIRRRVRKGLLIREHRGVYRVGHRAPSLEGRYLAAVLACGEDALLAGRAAAHLWGLLRGTAPPPEVTTVNARRVRGVLTRRTRRIKPDDATTWRGIPVTTVPRTLIDLAVVLDVDELARACHEAEVRYRMTPAQVERVLARSRTSPGAGKLRRILCGDIRVALSRLESRFLEHLREARLSLPDTNRLAGTHRVDCRWPKQRLTGYRYHHCRHAWERDRRREREARARGDELRRYTYGEVFEHPDFMLAELRTLLSPKRSG